MLKTLSNKKQTYQQKQSSKKQQKKKYKKTLINKKNTTITPSRTFASPIQHHFIIQMQPNTSGPLTGQLFAPSIEKLTTKFKKLLTDGPKKAKVVTDFDFTLSDPAFYASWQVLERSPYLSQDYRDKAKALGQKYYPTEISTTLSTEEKAAACAEWWDLAIKAACDDDLNRDKYNKILDFANKNIIFREHCRDLFVAAHDINLPVLIFSAGIADTIDSALLHYFPDFYRPMNPLYPIERHDFEGDMPNPPTEDERMIFLISNDLQFVDANGNELPSDYDHTKFKLDDHIVGFKTCPPIHVFNKIEKVVFDAPWYATQIKPRHNAIVMGDSLGDVAMVDENDLNTNVIRIGFLNTSMNKTVDGYLPKYLQNFDLVIVDCDDGVKIAAQVMDFFRKYANEDYANNDKLQEDYIKNVLLERVVEQRPDYQEQQQKAIQM